MKILTTGFLIADIIAPDLPNVASPSDVVFTPSSIDLHIGGHPANLSIDLVKLGEDPEEIGVVGAVGEDLFGDFIENSLKDYGLQVFLQKDSEVNTSKNLILAERNKDRRFHIDVGANANLDGEYVEKVFEEQNPDFFYAAVGVTGIDSEIRDLLRKAKSEGCVTFLDLIKPHGKDWDFVVPALEFADIFHCNDVEALNITKKDDIDSALEELMGIGNTKIIIVSKGEKGTLLRTPEYEISQPSFSVDSKDPSGAGDAFCAGVLLKVMEVGFDVSLSDLERLADILMFGQAAGAVACTEAGTTTAVSESRVMEVIEEGGEGVRKETVVREI